MKDAFNKLTGFPLAPLFASICAGFVYFATPVIGKLLLAVWVFLVVYQLGPAWRLSDLFGKFTEKQKKKGGDWPWSQ